MIYTPEEKTRLNAVLTAFQGYISENKMFDILCSNKCGYIHLPLDGAADVVEQIRSADRLFEILLVELTNDVQDLFLCGEHYDDYLFPREITEIRQRAVLYINGLPEHLQRYYTSVMEDYFANVMQTNSNAIP